MPSTPTEGGTYDGGGERPLKSLIDTIVCEIPGASAVTVVWALLKLAGMWLMRQRLEHRVPGTRS